MRAKHAFFSWHQPSLMVVTPHVRLIDGENEEIEYCVYLLPTRDNCLVREFYFLRCTCPAS
jgi:hypothetical protein